MISYDFLQAKLGIVDLIPGHSGRISTDLMQKGIIDSSFCMGDGVFTISFPCLVVNSHLLGYLLSG